MTRQNQKGRAPQRRKLDYQAVLAALVGVAFATGAQAQTPTSGEPDFFRAEFESLDRETVPPAPEGWGPDAEYDAMPAVGPEPRPEAPPERLSFDPAALRDLPFGLATVDDPALLHFLEFYATEGRRRMTNWLARAGRFRPLIEPMIEDAGLPTELFWVIAVESAFDPMAESHAGAVGLWQFVSRTARSHGLRVDRSVDERRDPVASTRAATEYFAELYETFGAWPLSLAAYNAGHGHVRGELREGNLTDFWELDDYGAVYTNARRYALRVMTIAIVDRNREVFGYETIVADEPWAFDLVDVPGNVRLSLLGEAVGLSAAEMQVYNPELVGLRTPSDSSTWRVRIPPGTHDEFVANYDRLRSRYGEDHQTVVLRFGETVEDVADAYDIPPRVLRSINDIAYDAPSPYGQELLVPARAERQTPSAPEEPAIVLVPQTQFAFADRVRVFYRTRPQDGLYAVARHFGVDPDHLAAWNDLDADAALVSGLVLQIFVDPERDLSQTVHQREDEVRAVRLHSPEWEALQESQEEAEQQRRRYYTVRRGDTVMEIAARFGVRSADIIRWNELGDEAMIIVGQELVVGR